MSQSDYIRYKKVSVDLRNSNLPPIFNSQDYTNYLQYSIENTITNSKPTLNRLNLSDEQRVFDMGRKHVNDCPSFPICTSTNDRTNRVAMIGPQFTPKYVPLYQKNSNNVLCTCKNVFFTTRITNCKCNFHL